MPIIVACPSCGGKLRVADSLLGKMVRCPTCDHTFQAASGEPPANPSRPLPLDLPLQLAIDDPSEPRPAPSRDAQGLLGAVELNRQADDEQPSPPRAAAPPPRLADEEDDDREIDRDRFRDIRRRGPRRDSEPHRGTVVLTLGVISLACLTIFCAPIGAILGVISWIMGQGDLRKMKRGDMDPTGQGITQAGWICGIIGTALNGLLTLGCMGMIGFIWYEENNRPLNPKPYVAPPPAQKWPPKQNQNPPGKKIR